MRTNIITIAVIAAALGAPLSAYAQDGYVRQGVTTGSTGTRVIVDSATGEVVGTINDEQRPRFREYVVQERVPSYTVPDRVAVGATLPEAGVTYYDVPERYAATPYRYTVVNDRTVLVDPRTRQIMQVVD